jgi:hypothetical protein
MTPYLGTLLQYIRPESQGAFYYDYRRFAKDPNLALIMTILFGIVGGESYYMGNWKRGVLMTIALFTGVGTLITIPMWVVRCFTIMGECEMQNDYLAYALVHRYLPQGPAPEPPQPATNPTANATRPNISGLPMRTR